MQLQPQKPRLTLVVEYNSPEETEHFDLGQQLGAGTVVAFKPGDALDVYAVPEAPLVMQRLMELAAEPYGNNELPLHGKTTTRD